VKKIKWITLITVAVLLLVSPCVNAGFVLDDKETLRGIKSMIVIIEDIRAKAENAGINKDMIRKDVELKLRMAGIKVVPKKEVSESSHLYVYTNIVKRGLAAFVFEVDIAFKQIVFLKRKPDLSCYAVTWDKRSASVVSETKMVRKVQDTVNHLVDEFIEDYLSVNPIQPSKPKGK
jgi:hypothetical protein